MTFARPHQPPLPPRRMPEYYDPTNRAAAPLILTSGDRADVLLSLLAAHQSAVGPHVAGIVLGGRLKVSQHVLDIFNNTPNVTLPVVHSYTPLLRVSAAILKSPGEIHATSTTKIARSIELFNSSIDVELLDQAIQKPPERTYVPPKVFQHRIYSQCQANPQRIVLPESDDVRIVTAAAQIAERKLARVILLGKHGESRQAGVGRGADPRLQPSVTKTDAECGNGDLKKPAPRSLPR